MDENQYGFTDKPSSLIKECDQEDLSNNHIFRLQIDRIGKILDVIDSRLYRVESRGADIPTKQSVNATDPYEVQVLAKVKELGITIEGIEFLGELIDRMQTVAIDASLVGGILEEHKSVLVAPFKTKLGDAFTKRKYE